MKYRSDFVTNSSSTISIWKDFSIDLKNIQKLKLNCGKKIIVYSGFFNDLKSKEFDLQILANSDKIKLFDFRAIYSELFVPWVVERFSLSDIFMEYLLEADIGIKLYVKKSDSDKLYLYAEFDSSKYPAKYMDFDNSANMQIISFEMDKDTTAKWDSLPHYYKYREFSTLTDKQNDPQNESIQNYWFDEPKVVRSEFLSDLVLKNPQSKNIFTHETEFGDFLVRISKFISKNLSDDFLKGFSHWLTNKHFVILPKNSIRMTAEGLCFLDGFMEEFYSEDVFDYDEMYDDISQKYKKIVKEA